MANYMVLRAAIRNVIKANGNNEITGGILQQSLLSMITSLGAGFQYAGLATPSVNPGTPDPNLFYIAATAGTYVNFGGLSVAENEIAILKYNGSWSKDSLGAASKEEVNILRNSLDSYNLDKTIPTLEPLVFDDLGMYNVATGADAFLVSDKIYTKGTYIGAISIYSTLSSYGFIYLIDSATKVVTKKIKHTITIGWNYIYIDEVIDNDTLIAIYGIKTIMRQEFVASPIEANASDYAFSVGLLQATPANPSIGDTITISTTTPERYTILPFTVLYFTPGELNTYVKETVKRIDFSINNLMSERRAYGKVLPLVYEDISQYGTQAAGNSNFFSTKVISAGAFIKSFRVYSNIASPQVFFYLVDNSTKRIVNAIIVSLAQGWNTVSANWFVGSDSIIGIYGNVFNYKLTTYGDELVDYAFSNGFAQASQGEFAIGDIVTLSTYLQGRNLLLPFQWELATNPLEVRYLRSIHKIHEHQCIISIIDDDCGIHIPEIWDSILAATDIRIGFACVTGIMAGIVTPPPLLTPITLTQLRSYYDSGHEIYSHSYSHPAFYSADTTEQDIERECLLSKIWLQQQGFWRSSDIIVYPGGLGITKVAKQNMVRRFYKFGVDTVIGDGVNDEPIHNPYAIHRINGDTATLQQLKDVADKAIATNKLFVIMNHAYELYQDKDAQVAKLTSFINYAKDSGATFMPLGEALHYMYGWGL